MQNIIINKIMQFYSSKSKLFFAVLTSLTLSSCAMTGRAMDKVTEPLGFKFKNPFFNDNNAANQKFNSEYFYGYAGKKRPAGNVEVLGEQQKSSTTLSYLDSEKYSHDKMADFWKKSYGDDYPKLKDVPTVKKSFIEIKELEDKNKPINLDKQDLSVDAHKLPVNPKDKPLTIEHTPVSKPAPAASVHHPATAPAVHYVKPVLEKAPVVHKGIELEADESVLDQIEFVDPTKYQHSK